MPASPRANTEGVVRVSVLSDGAPIAQTIELISVRVQRAANTVPSARLIISDGDMPTGAFAVADGATFAPGAAIVVKAGYGDQEETIFEGIVVKVGTRISGENDARTVVDCQDEAVKMTVGRRSANYVDKTDSEILSALIRGYGLSADVASTTVQFGELVQYYCADWDFLVSRADANGQLVIVTDGAVKVAAPETDAEPALKVTYGVDLMDFQAEIDARTQLSSVQAVAWDPKAQAIAQGAAASPASLQAQGNLDSATLARVVGLETFKLQTQTALTKESLDGWAKAQQLKVGLARIRGRMRFQGSALAKVGGLIELAGVGARFAGKVFVGGLEHEIADGNWTTEVEFGLSPEWFTGRADVVAPPAAGWLPGAEGLQVGVVMKLDGDPLGESRIQVKAPVLAAETEGVWARLAQFYASNTFGAFFLPEVGDEVILAYFNNDPSHPVILGSLYSSSRKPPYELAAGNDTKALVTRSKIKIEIDDKDKILTITTPANNKVVLSDKDKSITLEDQNNNKVTLDSGGITLDSPKDIKLTAKGGITLDAVNAVSITSKADVQASGLNIQCSANVAMVAKGGASAELSASGQTTVRGAMVMIN